MDTRRFILTMLAVAVTGAGAGYGASLLLPAPADGEETPEAAVLTEPDVAGPVGEQPDVDELLAAMPEEMRQQMEEDPELTAQVRDQLRAAIDSGQLPGASGAAPGGEVPATDAFGAGARNAEPLTGEVLSFEAGTLRLDTPDGEAEATVAPDTPVTLAKTAGEAGDAPAPGAEVTVIARRDESGALTAATIVVGQDGEGAFGAGGQRGAGRLATVITGAVQSFAGGVLTVGTADGAVEIAAPDETPVQITATVETAADELAAGVTATAFVQREEDGSLVAASIAVGATGRGLGGGLFGGGQGGGGRGGG